MRDLDELFTALSRSTFRAKFGLTPSDCAYIAGRSRSTIQSHARDFIRQRLAPAQPKNDGKQTPMKGHPVFVAQHATGTCCRTCLSKWHAIDSGRALTDDEVDYVLQVIDFWISRELRNHSQPAGSQMRLFEKGDKLDTVENDRNVACHFRRERPRRGGL
ncbi:MAG: DUF4186 domain-containing protein [Pirellulaceae bacterium]